MSAFFLIAAPSTTTGVKGLLAGQQCTLGQLLVTIIITEDMLFASKLSQFCCVHLGSFMNVNIHHHYNLCTSDSVS